VTITVVVVPKMMAKAVRIDRSLLTVFLACAILDIAHPFRVFVGTKELSACPK
jgi:hypothetical protein